MKWHIEIEKEDSTKIGKLCSMKTGNIKWFKTIENAQKWLNKWKFRLRNVEKVERFEIVPFDWME